MVSAMARGIFHLHFPFGEQPLRDIKAIGVVVKPMPQLDRGNVFVLSQTQLANLLIELRRQELASSLTHSQMPKMGLACQVL